MEVRRICFFVAETPQSQPKAPPRWKTSSPATKSAIARLGCQVKVHKWRRKMNVHSGSANYESDSVVPFTSKNAISDDDDQLDKAGQTILKLLHRPPAWPRRTAGTRWTWRRSFRISYARPKIGSRSWRLRLSFTEIRRIAPNSGSIRFILKLRSGSFGSQRKSAAQCSLQLAGAHRVTSHRLFPRHAPREGGEPRH